MFHKKFFHLFKTMASSPKSGTKEKGKSNATTAKAKPTTTTTSSSSGVGSTSSATVSKLKNNKTNESCSTKDTPKRSKIKSGKYPVF